MEKLEKEKKKHNHKLTDLLKVSIFCILMLAPFMAVASKCMYVVCNKNAKDSYYGETINESYLVSVDTLVSHNKYVFNNELVGSTAYDVLATLMYVSNVSVNNVEDNSITKINMLYYNNNNAYFSTYAGDTLLNTYNLCNTIIYVDFEFISSNNLNYINLFNYWYQVQYNEYSYLDNVFNYATNQLEDINIFNWAKSTGIYTPINAMTNGLGITTNVIPMLLAYWAILTAVYIVFDLIIWIFTKLTHLISTD